MPTCANVETCWYVPIFFRYLPNTRRSTLVVGRGLVRLLIPVFIPWLFEKSKTNHTTYTCKHDLPDVRVEKSLSYSSHMKINCLLRASLLAVESWRLFLRTWSSASMSLEVLKDQHASRMYISPFTRWHTCSSSFSSSSSVSVNSLPFASVKLVYFFRNVRPVFMKWAAG